MGGRLSALAPGASDASSPHAERPDGDLNLIRHPAFVAMLRGLGRVELMIHGLSHINPLDGSALEFAGLSQEACLQRLKLAQEVFQASGLTPAGFIPPAWDLGEPLLAAVVACGFEFVASSRDLETPVEPEAAGRGSGVQGMPLFAPAYLPGTRVLHFPTNFQATSGIDRARAILRCGGLLSVKAHIDKELGEHVMLDGLDALYCNYLDLLFETLETEFGDAIWWTSMAEITARVKAGVAAAGAPTSIEA
jgi:hypothetical protein